MSYFKQTCFLSILLFINCIFANKAYITDVGSAQVYTILNQIIGTVSVAPGVPAFANPSFIAISPFGEVAYVGDYGSGATYAINTATDIASEVTFENGDPISCFCFAFSPLSRKAYGGAGGTIYIIDTVENQVIGTINNLPSSIGSVYSIAFNGDGSFAYFVDQAHAYVIDALTDTYVGEIALGSGVPPFSQAYSVACNPVNLNQAYIGDNGTPGVYIIDTLTNTATGLVEVNAEGYTSIPSAYQVLYSQDGKKAYVAAFTVNQTFVIDADNNTSTQLVSIPLGLASFSRNLGVALSPDGGEGIVTNVYANYFQYFDPEINSARSVVYPPGASQTQGVAYIVPLPPKNVKVTSQNIDFGTIYAVSNRITWDSASPYISEYSVYKDGVFLTTVSGYEYTDINVIPNTTYTYSVVSQVLPGVQSAPVSVTISD